LERLFGDDEVNTLPQHGSFDGATSSTRERILDAAERLFAARGFAAASVREITTAAGANIAAVNYHFGSKDGLYRETVVRRLRAQRDARLAVIAAVMSAGVPTLEDLLREFSRAVVEPATSGDEGLVLVRLMHREITEPRLPPELGFEELQRPVETALVEAILALEPGVDATWARLSVNALMAQHLWVIQVSSIFADPHKSALAPFMRREMLEHITVFTAAGIRGGAPRAGSP
jgi:AcrR family transcriptional regulator